MTSNKYSARNFDLKILNDKRENELSKILELDSLSFNTQLISNMQSRINNPLFKLSPNDYKVICGNKMMINMMSKVIKCDAKQLKKFCKYINVFIENIESSPKSIKNKIIASRNLMRGSLSVLPYDILDKIVKKYISLFPSKYVLKDWIPLEKLNWTFLSINPNAIELLKANLKKIDWKLLSSNPNPNAIELLKSKINEKNEMSEDDYYDLDKSNKINWNLLSVNPNAIELLRENPDKIVWSKLSSNPCQDAIKLLKENRDKIDWYWLSKNPKAIELLKEKIKKENQMSEEELEELNPYQKISWINLSINPAAIELLKANFEKIHWDGLSANTNLKAIELLKEKINAENLINQRALNNLNYSEKIDWDVLSANPNAIELLKNNLNKINWEAISNNTNPNAIELLRTNPNNIDWDSLSLNPYDKAIELLKAYPKKINWEYLSGNHNPEAIKLLKANPKKINWEYLSANPNAIELLKENPKKINWRNLSSNPAIFDEVFVW